MLDIEDFNMHTVLECTKTEIRVKLLRTCKQSCKKNMQAKEAPHFFENGHAESHQSKQGPQLSKSPLVVTLHNPQTVK